MSETDRHVAAKNLYESGRYAEAEALCRNLLSENKEHSGALHYLGLTADHLGSRTEAIKICSVIIFIKLISHEMAVLFNMTALNVGYHIQFDNNRYQGCKFLYQLEF